MTDAEREALAATVAPAIDALDAQRGDGRHPWQVGDQDPRDVGADALAVMRGLEAELAELGQAAAKGEVLGARERAGAALTLINAGVPLAAIDAEPERFAAFCDMLRHDVEGDRQAPSPDFEDTDARGRLAEWFAASGYGTFKDLADATQGDVNRKAVAAYVRGEKPPTKLFAAWLRELAGEDKYFEIVHGWGTWGPYVRECERRAATERLAARLDAMDAETALGALDVMHTYLDGLDARGTS